MDESNKSMNDFIRGIRPAETSGGQAITPEQADRIEKYVSLGASYPEARDLVLSWQPGAKLKPPPGNAGNGTGQPPKVKPDMNDWLRRVSRR